MLGLVSGGAGIASLSAQLLTSAQALKRFFADAKNAPAHLKALAFDIETMGMILKELDFQPVQCQGIAITLLDRCVSSVRSEVRVIERYVQRLNSRLKRHRLSGRLWAAFEDPEI